jgi:hypothetical protein
MPSTVGPRTPEPLTVAALAALAAVGPRPNYSADLAERAAIIAEGACVPLDWADGFARLEAMPVPCGVGAGKWLAMVNAAGRFLDQWGSKAAALGWTASELFGLDPNAPINRRDRRGAAFYLIGADVLALTADEITLRIGGSIQRVRRPDQPSTPAWDNFARTSDRAEPNLD